MLRSKIPKIRKVSNNTTTPKTTGLVRRDGEESEPSRAMVGMLGPGPGHVSI